MNQVTGSAASPTKSVFDAFGAIGCGIYVGGAVAVTLYFLQAGGIRLTEGLPVAAVVAAAVAALLTLVRCVLTGFYVPLAMIGVFVLGFGAITKISANLPDPAAGGLGAVQLRIDVAMPWVFFGICMLALSLACLTPRQDLD